MNVNKNDIHKIATEEAKDIIKEATKGENANQDFTAFSENLIMSAFKRMPLPQLYKVRTILNKLIGLREK